MMGRYCSANDSNTEADSDAAAPGLSTSGCSGSVLGLAVLDFLALEPLSLVFDLDRFLAFFLV